MKATSPAQCSTVASLLAQGYSLCQIEAKTDLGKSTIGRISRELEVDKENHPGGCPAKLTPHNKQAIVQQISTGRLDTAVQATNFINNIISNPVSPQTVWNVLKEEGVTANQVLVSGKVGVEWTWPLYGGAFKIGVNTMGLCSKKDLVLEGDEVCPVEAQLLGKGLGLSKSYRPMPKAWTIARA
ncbi:hypothetical protein E4T56_gene6944 [Termitomyces sp. T112]|nr:hypothetical protein E4T56_gene6944 [Termitomyces sp. T112]